MRILMATGLPFLLPVAGRRGSISIGWRRGRWELIFPIPVALPFFSFTGWKGSFYGDLHTYGKQGVSFYTETKTVTSRWFDDPGKGKVNMTIRLK